MGRLWNDIKGSVNDSSNVLTIEQVKEIQQVLLMMMKDIDNICRSNGLTYIMMGGTAIGSLRHKGFIPWDDDVDLAMPRSDYEIFAKIVRKEWVEKYTLTDSIRNTNYGKVIPKLRLNGTIYKTVLDIDSNDIQMKIDIFIIENTYDNKVLRWIEGVFCSFFGLALSCRRLAGNKDYFSQYYKGRDFKIKVFLGHIFSFASLDRWANWTERCYSFCKNDQSKYVTIPADGRHFFKGLIDRSLICETIDSDFEDCVFYLPKGYDFYLKRIYGDYMQIPPKNERKLSLYSEIDYGQYNNMINKKKL